MATESPNLCSNGCGFFGSPENMNLCSKCFRDQAVSAFAAFKKSSDSLATPETASIVEEATTKAKEVLLPEPGQNRCGCCKKKVGVVGFVCRCGATFCGSHRYPEAHGCSVDFKVDGKEAIAKANPMVVSDKLKRRC